MMAWESFGWTFLDSDTGQRTDAGRPWTPTHLGQWAPSNLTQGFSPLLARYHQCEQNTNFMGREITNKEEEGQNMISEN